jgi:coproporphyrinogen III oxidase-like Fe-S oxidoreductase
MPPERVVLNTEEFKHLWESKPWKDDESVQLYIDNPFCVRKCGFCIFQSTVATPSSDVYRKYYLEYLPAQLEAFSSIIEKSRVSAVYFGGGTASLMTPRVMRRIFGAIPGFQAIPAKCFESNPLSLDRAKMDLLIENKFSYVSMGVQTLDREVCIQQNRLPVSPKALAAKVDYLQQHGVHVNCDLLAFMRTGDVEDLADLERDLHTLETVVKPHVIAVYPMYQRISSCFAKNGKQCYQDEEAEHNYELISSLRKCLTLFCSTSAIYRPASENVASLDREALLENSGSDYYLSSLEPSELSFLNAYNSSAYPLHSAEQNVLAFGGYDERMPYSYMGKNCYYVNVNFAWNSFYILVDS